MANCTKCGAVLHPRVRYCGSCGAEQRALERGAAAKLLSTAIPQLLSYAREHVLSVALTFGTSLLLHTYLVFLNNGFDVGKVSALTPFLHVGSNPGASSFLIWTSLSGLAWSFARTAATLGPIRAFNTIVMHPVNLVRKLVHSTPGEYACWAIGGGAALLASAALGANRPAGLSMALLWTFIGLSERGKKLAEAVTHSLGHVLLDKLGEARPNAGQVHVVVAAIAPGFAVAGLLGSPELDALAGIVAVAGGAYLYMSQRRDRGMAAASGHTAILILIASSLAGACALIELLWSRVAWAHDFARQENNGSLISALKSGAGPRAVAQGIGPSAGAAIGALMPAVKAPPNYGGKEDPWDPPPEEQNRMWVNKHVVWDPQSLSWRPPKPGELPPPTDPPESVPPYERQNPRDDTPPECLELYDQYVKAEADTLQLEGELKAAADAYQHAQLLLNENLVKLTLQLQMDTADLFMAGAGGVKSGMAVASVAASAAAAMGELLRAAMTKLKYLEEVVLRLIEAAGELTRRLASMERSVGVLKDTTESLAGEAQQLGEGVESSGQRVATTREALGVAEQVEELAGQREAVVEEASEAERRLDVAKQVHERRVGLQDWAEGEKAVAREEGARAFAAKHGELEDAKSQLEQLRVKDAGAVEAARAESEELLPKIKEASERANRLANEVTRSENAGRARARKAEYLKAEDVEFEADRSLQRIEKDEIRYQNEMNDYQRDYLESHRQAFREAEMRLDAAQAKRTAANQAWQDFLTEAEASGHIDREAQARLAEARAEASRECDEANQALLDAKYAHDNAESEAAQAAHDRWGEMLGEAQQRTAEARVQLERAQAELEKARDAYESIAHQDNGQWNPEDAPRLQEEQKAASEEYVQLTRQYDEARARYERLKSETYTDSAKATELKARQERLAQELRDWKDPDWEDVAARRNPDKYQAWKLEVEGTDPAGEASGELDPLKQKVAELKEREDRLEKQIADARDRLPPGTSKESLEGELRQLEQERQAKLDALTKVRQDSADAKARLESAQAELEATRALEAGKQQDIDKARQEQADAQAEVDRLKSEAPADVIDEVAKGSHDLSQKVKPAAAQWIEDKLKAGLARVGKTWSWAFDGQSPEEVAGILKNGHDLVQKRLDELNAKQEAYDAARAAMRDVKPKLDGCNQQHTYWKGPS